MPIVEWEDDFIVGIPQFDEHHRYLVSLLNKAYDDFTSGSPAENAGIILDELIDYATYHFAAEEGWMREQSYPGASEHSQEHAQFSRRVVEMQKDFHAGRTNLSIELLTFLKNWLINHILESDAGYSRYIAAGSAKN